MKKIKFDKMVQGTKYRLLHGGEKDHGYDYAKDYCFEKECFILINLTKGSRSSLNPSRYEGLTFVEKNEKFKKYPNLDFKVEFTSKSIVVGCQSIDAFSAQLLATDILEHFATNKVEKIA